MCGIFGLVVREGSDLKFESINAAFERLGVLSELRGKDSSGFLSRNSKANSISILKTNEKITSLFRSESFMSQVSKDYHDYKAGKTSLTWLGHSRLVTHGSQLDHQNNQPVSKHGIALVHNGIITNADSLWIRTGGERSFDIDSEVLNEILDNAINKGKNYQEICNFLIKNIEGTFSTAFISDRTEDLALLTNNGSLYVAHNEDIFVFASEGFIVKEVARLLLRSENSKLNVQKVDSNSGVVFNLSKFRKINFDSCSTLSTIEVSLTEAKDKYQIDIKNLTGSNGSPFVVDIEKFSTKENEKSRKLLEYNAERISRLRRCTRCILPETFPFISFDKKGVCNYCSNYIPKNQPKSLEELKKLVEPYKSKDASCDVLVPFSGGRDSTYVLHFVKKELGLNPIAYTYDWGMVTDVARENIAKVCGRLGVENIIVAADLSKKRRNIRLNIEAWLKKPDLGMIPLFMAGDKQFFKYANKIKKQENIDLNIWGINFLENTDFKVGFCGVPPDWNKEMIYSMKLSRQLKLFRHVAKNFIMNPSYLNVSILDTLDSFLSRYNNPRKDYYHFFDYHNWDEKEIEKILFEEYDWKGSDDLKSTWRIGDGTASFYNYIYYTVAGFSEFDTFRSNQIREGMISREEAIELSREENKPRYESLRWYLEIVGLDYNSTITAINKISKLYD